MQLEAHMLSVTLCFCIIHKHVSTHPQRQRERSSEKQFSQVFSQNTCVIQACVKKKQLAFQPNNCNWSKLYDFGDEVELYSKLLSCIDNKNRKPCINCVFNFFYILFQTKLHFHSSTILSTFKSLWQIPN